MTPLDEGVADHLNEGRLKLELLKMDIELRRKQTFWETPRNLAIVLGAMAAIFAAVFGALGYKIGQTPAPPPVIINLPPQSK
jgi:hypothetical protein